MIKLECTREWLGVVSPAPKPVAAPTVEKPSFPGAGSWVSLPVVFRQPGPSGVLLPPTARINLRFREVQRDATSGGRRCVSFLGDLVFVLFLINSWLPPSTQTATDSSSNSSQKREQPTRTISSPTSCEHRKVYTLGHLHDPYPTDHYHLEQVSGDPVPWRSQG